jgi:hypothetical protein
LLKELVETIGCKSWKKVSEKLVSRSPVQCLHRWTKILQPGLKKGPWTQEEDNRLIQWTKREGPCKWSMCAEFITGRSGKQCRERWFNTLNPSVKKGNWSEYEDFLIFKLFKIHGSKWSKIASYFKGRTENSIKNRFYSTLRRLFSDNKKNINPTEQIAESESSNLAVINNYNHTHLDDLLKYFDEAFNEKMRNYSECYDKYFHEKYCFLLNEELPKSPENKILLGKKTRKDRKTGCEKPKDDGLVDYDLNKIPKKAFLELNSSNSVNSSVEPIINSENNNKQLTDCNSQSNNSNNLASVMTSLINLSNLLPNSDNQNTLLLLNHLGELQNIIMNNQVKFEHQIKTADPLLENVSTNSSAFSVVAGNNQMSQFIQPNYNLLGNIYQMFMNNKHN